MELGMVGLGRMGANMAKRLSEHGHSVVGFDFNPDAVAGVVAEGARGASSVASWSACCRRHAPSG